MLARYAPIHALLQPQRSPSSIDRPQSFFFPFPFVFPASLYPARRVLQRHPCPTQNKQNKDKKGKLLDCIDKPTPDPRHVRVELSTMMDDRYPKVPDQRPDQNKRTDAEARPVFARRYAMMLTKNMHKEENFDLT